MGGAVALLGLRLRAGVAQRLRVKVYCLSKLFPCKENTVRGTKYG